MKHGARRVHVAGVLMLTVASLVSGDGAAIEDPAEAASDCWHGGFTREKCCDTATYGTMGDEGCWDAVYTFERCCGNGFALQSELPQTDLFEPQRHEDGVRVEVDKGLTEPPVDEGAQFVDKVYGESCWDTYYNESFCCSRSFGEQGHQACWTDIVTYERCCVDYGMDECNLDHSLRAGVAALMLAAVVALLLLVLVAHGLPDADDVGSSPRPRSAVLDNAKFVVCAMVIAEHFETVAITAPISRFHHRLFCFISGVNCTKPIGERALRSLAFRVVAPLILYCILVEPLLLPLLAEKSEMPHDWQSKSYATSLRAWASRALLSFFKSNTRVIWYLHGLICWRLWSIPLQVFRPSLRLPVALVVSAVAGYAQLGEGYTGPNALAVGVFRMSKAAALFPVFVLGQYPSLERAFRSLPPLRPWTFAVGIMLLTAAAAYDVQGGDIIDQKAITFSWAHIDLQFCSDAAAAAMWMRGVYFNLRLLVLGLVMLLFCCPRSPTFVSTAGRYSMYPYLLHLAIRPWWSRLIFEVPDDWIYVRECLRYIGPPVVALLLSSWPVRAVFWIIFEPVWLEVLLCGAAPTTKPLEQADGKHPDYAPGKEMPQKNDRPVGSSSTNREFGVSDVASDLSAGVRPQCQSEGGGGSAGPRRRKR